VNESSLQKLRGSSWGIGTILVVNRDPLLLTIGSFFVFLGIGTIYQMLDMLPSVYICFSVLCSWVVSIAVPYVKSDVLLHSCIRGHVIPWTQRPEDQRI
jgi:hypothetical protein